MMDASYADHTLQIFTYLLLFWGRDQSGKTNLEKEKGRDMSIFSNLLYNYVSVRSMS